MFRQYKKTEGDFGEKQLNSTHQFHCIFMDLIEIERVQSLISTNQYVLICNWKPHTTQLAKCCRQLVTGTWKVLQHKVNNLSVCVPTTSDSELLITITVNEYATVLMDSNNK